jgi:hypothetical protein
MSASALYLRPRKAKARFDVLPCIDGYDVIALDTGRPVDHRETRWEAQEAAGDLNYAAMGGVRSLAKALGASNPSDPSRAEGPDVRGGA